MMTLTESRAKLEAYLEQDIPDDIREAIKAAITMLPRESKRPTASERLETIRTMIRFAKNGFDPFADRSRNPSNVCWRQCVWMTLYSEGYRSGEIAKATGYDHATVWWGVSRLKGYLSCGDMAATETLVDLNRIILNYE